MEEGDIIKVKMKKIVKWFVLGLFHKGRELPHGNMCRNMDLQPEILTKMQTI